MRRGTSRAITWVLIAVLLTTTMLLGACRSAQTTEGTAPARHEGPLLVIASIAPLGDFVRHVGGENVQVEVLVPPGASPHTYEPTPGQMTLLHKADVLVLNGIGLEFWKDKVLNSVSNPRLHVVIAAEGILVLQTGEHGEGGNPHVWLDPINAALEVARIRDALVAVDPAHKDADLANGAAYIEDLKALDRDIMLTTAAFPNKKFVAFHPAWEYFARRYGLVQAAVIERTPGSEPSPGEIAQIVKTVRETGARAIIAEPQFSTKAAEAIAAESGAKVVLLNPLGEPPDFDYIQTMRHNVEQLKSAMLGE